MKMKLPDIAETLLLATNERNLEKYLTCFTEDAVYTDSGENETMAGKKAIEKNFRELKFEFQSEPISVKETADMITMKVKTTGNFPGSPLNFIYLMKIRDGLIQDLKVDLA